MSDWGILSLDQENLDKELKRMKNIMQGKIPGVISKITSKDSYSQIPNLNDFLIDGGDEKSQTAVSPYTVTKTRSTYRDIPYSLVGRRFLYTMGLNRRILSLKHRY